MSKTLFDVFIEEEEEKSYFKNLCLFLKKEYEYKNIYPKKEDLFKALKLIKLNELKVIIFGQDPYYQKDVADGLCFSTKESKTPRSLKNIFKELKREYLDFNYETNCLEQWARQGVLLMNIILSVEENKPLSHKNKGWETFTKNLIFFLNKQENNLIFLLWGNFAKSQKQYINTSKHIVLESSHPSGFSFYNGFWLNNHFKLVNQHLRKWNQKEINWNLKKQEI